MDVQCRGPQGPVYVYDEFSIILSIKRKFPYIACSTEANNIFVYLRPAVVCTMQLDIK